LDGGPYHRFFYFTLTGTTADEQAATKTGQYSGRTIQTTSDARQRIETTLKWIEELKFEDLVFWTFGKPLNIIKWIYSLRELRQFIRIKVGEKQTDAVQQFEVMAKILSLAFGGKQEETKIQNKSQLIAALNSMKE